MTGRNDKKLVREIDKLDEKEALAVSNYISEILSARFSQKTEKAFNDELIATLSDKRENQRARQVIEWEKVRRRNIQKAV
jgi:hypothetical protein